MCYLGVLYFLISIDRSCPSTALWKWANIIWCHPSSSCLIVTYQDWLKAQNWKDSQSMNWIHFSKVYILIQIIFLMMSITVPKLQVLIISTSRNVLLLLYLVHWSCVRQRNKEEVQLDLHWIAERGAFRGCSKVPSARSSGCSSIGNTLCFPTSKRMWCLFIQGKSFWLM